MRITSEWSNTEAGREVQVSWVAFTSGGRQDDELDTRVKKASAVTSFALLGCRETRIVKKGKALNFQNSFIPILTYGHELWVMIERVRSQVQCLRKDYPNKLYLPKQMGEDQ